MSTAVANGVGAGLLVIAAVTAAVRSEVERRRARIVGRLRPSVRGVGAPRLPAPPARLTTHLDAAAVEADPAVVWAGWWAVASTATVLAIALAGPGLALLVGAVALVGPAGWLAAVRGRGAARMEAALPIALESLARALRSGASLAQALAAASHVAPGLLGADLRLVVLAISRGAGVVAALEGWAERRPLPGVRLAVAALCLGAETGGAQARAVDGVAATLRHRLAAVAEVAALSSSARASALVIALSPLAFGALAGATDPRTVTFLFRTPLGLAFLAGGLTLDGLGALWMARITRLAP